MPSSRNGRPSSEGTEVHWVDLSKYAPVATIALQRPPANAMNVELAVAEAMVLKERYGGPAGRDRPADASLKSERPP